ncbi:hypothetical protein SNEBB_006336 [Seison nebaliae]|nr:hypothetical protein SNEBB_006336 [Seison nebaliae]
MKILIFIVFLITICSSQYLNYGNIRRNSPNTDSQIDTLSADIQEFDELIANAKYKYQKKSQTRRKFAQNSELNYLNEQAESLLNEQKELQTAHQTTIDNLITEYKYRFQSELDLNEKRKIIERVNHRLDNLNTDLNKVQRNIDVRSREIRDKEYEMKEKRRTLSKFEKRLIELETNLFQQKNRHQKRFSTLGNLPEDFYDALQIKYEKAEKEDKLRELEEDLEKMQKKMLQNKDHGTKWEYLIFLKSQKKRDLNQEINKIEEEIQRLTRQTDAAAEAGIDYAQQHQSLEREIDFLARKKYSLLNKIRVNTKRLAELKTQNNQEQDQLQLKNSTIREMDISVELLRQKYYKVTNKIAAVKANLKKIDKAITAKTRENAELSQQAKSRGISNAEDNYKKIQSTLDEFLKKKKEIKESIYSALDKRFELQDHLTAIETLKKKIAEAKVKSEKIMANGEMIKAKVSTALVEETVLNEKYGPLGKKFSEILAKVKELDVADKKVNEEKKKYPELVKRGYFSSTCLKLDNTVPQPTGYVKKISIRNGEKETITCTDPKKPYIIAATFRVDILNMMYNSKTLGGLSPCTIDATMQIQKECLKEATCEITADLEKYDIPNVLCVDTFRYLYLDVIYTCTKKKLNFMETEMYAFNGLNNHYAVIDFGPLAGDKFIVGNEMDWVFTVDISKDSFDRRYATKEVKVSTNGDMVVEVTHRNDNKMKFVIHEATVVEEEAMSLLDSRFGSCVLIPGVVYYREISSNFDKEKILAVLALLNRASVNGHGTLNPQDSVILSAYLFTSMRVHGIVSQIVVAILDTASVGYHVSFPYGDEQGGFSVVDKVTINDGTPLTGALVSDGSNYPSFLPPGTKALSLAYPGFAEPK